MLEKKWLEIFLDIGGKWIFFEYWGRNVDGISNGLGATKDET